MVSSSTVDFVVSQINKRDLFAYESTFATKEVKDLAQSDAALYQLLQILNSGSVTDMKKFAESNKDVFVKYNIVEEVVVSKLNVIQFVSHVNEVAISKKTDSIELPLAEIATISGVADELEAEDVVVLASTFGLVAATVDETRNVAVISSITPVRSLESKELWKALGVKVDEWLKQIRELKNLAKPLSA